MFINLYCDCINKCQVYSKFILSNEVHFKCIIFGINKVNFQRVGWQGSSCFLRHTSVSIYLTLLYLNYGNTFQMARANIYEGMKEGLSIISWNWQLLNSCSCACKINLFVLMYGNVFENMYIRKIIKTWKYISNCF